MNDRIGTLVKRKIGGLTGVLMSATAIDKSSEYHCEVAFGFLTKADALANKKFDTDWAIVESHQIEFLSNKK